jgi:hypothetical protein
VLADAQTRTSCRDRRVRQERRFEDGPHGSRPRGIGRGSRTSLRECPSVEERRFEDARTSRICGISGRANSDIASQRSGCARTGTYRKPGRRPWRAVSDARIRTLRSGRRGAPGPARQVTRWAASGREILGVCSETRWRHRCSTRAVDRCAPAPRRRDADRASCARVGGRVGAAPVIRWRLCRRRGRVIVSSISDAVVMELIR